MEKKKLKGFTLIELIIVMAIFSLLMVGAMSLVDPVSKIYKHSNDFEKTYSYVDNIQNYLQGSLQYADNVWVYQGSMTTDQIRAEMLEYKEAFYKDIVSTSNGTSIDYSKLKLRVMTILNSDMEADVDGNGSIDDGEAYPKGQILMQTVDMTSDATVLPPLSNYAPQLNETFFNGKYSYDYIIGSSSFVTTGDSAMVNNLAEINVDSVPGSLTPSNFAFGIVTYDTNDNKDGSAKFTNVTGTKADSSTYVYRKYDTASQYSIANIPLLNIINRNGLLNTSYYVYGKADDGVTIDTSKAEKYPGTNYGAVPHPSASHSSFEHAAASISMSSDDNIYIIYSLNDEVNVPQ